MRGAIELTEETGATYGVPEQPEESDRSETPARSGSAFGLTALCLAAAVPLAEFLGLIPWEIGVTVALSWVWASALSAS